MQKRFDTDGFKREIKNTMPAIAIIAIAVAICNILFDGFCLFRLMVGIPCPGCGLTRAAILLLKGHVVESFEMHPMLIPLLFVLPIYFIEKYYIDNEKPSKKKRLKVTYIYGCTVAIAMIILYIVKMKLYFPNVEPYIYYKKNLLRFINRIVEAVPR